MQGEPNKEDQNLYSDESPTIFNTKPLVDIIEQNEPIKPTQFTKDQNIKYILTKLEQHKDEGRHIQKTSHI